MTLPANGDEISTVALSDLGDRSNEYSPRSIARQLRSHDFDDWVKFFDDLTDFDIPETSKKE